MFGTDGVRGRAKWLIGSGAAVAVARALASLKQGATVAVGTDTRVSSPEIERLVTGGLLSAGANVLHLGRVPTPAVSVLVKKYGADFGVMITASHNPPDYNGIKIFDSNGLKLSDVDEFVVEEIIKTGRFCRGIGRETEMQSSVDDYVNYVIKRINADFSGKKVTLDCCHGATSGVAKRIFEALGAQIEELCGSPNGELVGVYSGSTHVEYLVGNVQTDIGFAYDGDGDRVIAVADGEVWDGCKMLNLLASSMGVTAVASTVMANMSLEKALQQKGITLKRSDVGDKNLSKLMRSENIELGAEPSGHIIIGSDGVGDGITASAEFLKRFVKGTKSYVENPFVTKDVCAPRSSVDLPEVKAATEEAEKIVGENGRIVVRPSGTEPLIRIYAEAETAEQAARAAGVIAKSLHFL